MSVRLEAVNPAPVVVDLTQEEDEGELGGPIFLVAKNPVVLVDTAAGRERAQEELIAELDHLLVHVAQSETTNGEYTPTGPSPWGLEF